MRELLAEVHHRAWLATAVAGGLAVASAALRLPLPAAMAAMTAGALLMWISEEKHRLVAAMAPGQDPIPAPVLPPVPAPAAPRGSAVPVREWTNPFPRVPTHAPAAPAGTPRRRAAAGRGLNRVRLTDSRPAP